MIEFQPFTNTMIISDHYFKKSKVNIIDKQLSISYIAENMDF